jgi:hypothetical protein
MVLFFALGATVGCSSRGQDDEIVVRTSALTETAPTTAREKAMVLDYWEPISLAIPPNVAGCGANGAFLIVTPRNGAGFLRVWRADLSCIDGTSASTCSPTSSVTYPNASRWPAINVSGFVDDPTGAADGQIVRFANGTLLMSKQGIRRDVGTAACTGGGNSCRGVEYFFRSVDCGFSWVLSSVLDSKSDGPTSNPSKYYSTAFQSGHDRPELYVDDFNPSRVYMTVRGVGPGAGPPPTVLYRSDNRGGTWTHAGELPLLQIPSYMTSVSSGKLYVASWYGSPDANGDVPFGVVTYDPVAKTMSGPLKITSKVQVMGTHRLAGGNEGLTRAVSDSTGDTLRAHWGYKQPNGDYALQVAQFRVNGSTLTQTPNQFFVIPPTGRSILGAIAVPSDRLEYTGTENAAIVYWWEVKTANDGVNWGPAKLQYKRFSGEFGAGAVGCMSLSGTSNTCRTWTNFTNSYGDYYKGAFWSASGSRKFAALWGEQTSATGGFAVHTNVLTLTP